MIDRRHVRLLLVALLAVLCSSAAHTAKKQPTSPAPTPKPSAPATPAPAARPDSSALVMATPPRIARTPGPLVTPGSPTADRTTIIPFPIPGDTSRAAIARAKQMNVPRQGMTLVGPPPVGGVLGSVPEPLAPPAPEYPKAARDAGIQGTVVVMAQVLTDGTVGEVRVLKSIPALDDAAVQAVKRMRFKPTWWHGGPAVDWVGVPVRFTLH